MRAHLHCLQKAVENGYAEMERLWRKTEVACELGQPADSFIPVFSTYLCSSLQ